MLPTMLAKDASAFLKTSPVFAVLPAREIAALGEVVVEEAHRPREYIFMEGEGGRLVLADPGALRALAEGQAE
jgi:hypothetical protein